MRSYAIAKILMVQQNAMHVFDIVNVSDHFHFNTPRPQTLLGISRACFKLLVGKINFIIRF